MNGANKKYQDSFTDEELEKLKGVAAGSFITWRGEKCVIESVDPLIIAFLWDMPVIDGKRIYAVLQLKSLKKGARLTSCRLNKEPGEIEHILND